MRQIKLGADRIYFGEDAVKALAELPAVRKRAYIVMSGTIQEELGQLKVVTDVLESAGFAWKSNTNVEPEPCWESVRQGVEEMREFEPDWVIGFGGGSAMDAAKAMWVFYENPQYKSLEEVMPPAPLELRKKARVCCITTSAGTGSECTRAALIKDPKCSKEKVLCAGVHGETDSGRCDSRPNLLGHHASSRYRGMRDGCSHACHRIVCDSACQSILRCSGNRSVDLWLPCTSHLRERAR